MKAKILELNREKTIFWSLLGILLLCGGLYIFSINSMVHNVVQREKLEATATELSLSIGSHEFEYISLRNKVNIQLAYSRGFKEAPTKTFISKKSLNYVSYLSNEI